MIENDSSLSLRLLRALRLTEKWLCVIAFVVLVSVVFADVVSREFSGSGFYWASQVGVWANIIVVMAGFGIASADGAQLRPRFADSWLPPSWDSIVGTLQHLTSSLFCLGIGALAAAVTFDSWQLGVVSIDLYVPIWPVQAMLPAAFFAAALRHGIYVFKPELRPEESGALADMKPEQVA